VALKLGAKQHDVLLGKFDCLSKIKNYLYKGTYFKLDVRKRIFSALISENPHRLGVLGFFFQVIVIKAV
jgi:hypothetical protein